MAVRVGKMFECVCGEVFRGENAPDECPKCGQLEEFIELPEEIVEEREKDLVNEEVSLEYEK